MSYVMVLSYWQKTSPLFKTCLGTDNSFLITLNKHAINIFLQSETSDLKKNWIQWFVIFSPFSNLNSDLTSLKNFLSQNLASCNPTFFFVLYYRINCLRCDGIHAEACEECCITAQYFRCNIQSAFQWRWWWRRVRKWIITNWDV